MKIVRQNEHVLILKIATGKWLIAFKTKSKYDALTLAGEATYDLATEPKENETAKRHVLDLLEEYRDDNMYLYAVMSENIGTFKMFVDGHQNE